MSQALRKQFTHCTLHTYWHCNKQATHCTHTRHWHCNKQVTHCTLHTCHRHCANKSLIARLTRVTGTATNQSLHSQTLLALQQTSNSLHSTHVSQALRKQVTHCTLNTCHRHCNKPVTALWALNAYYHCTRHRLTRHTSTNRRGSKLTKGEGVTIHCYYSVTKSTLKRKRTDLFATPAAAVPS